MAEEVRKLSEHTNEAINEIDSSISILIQTVGDAAQQINNNKDLVKTNFSNMGTSIENSVVIAGDSKSSMEVMQNQIISIVEKIQFIEALSFENGEFANDVDDVAAEVRKVDIEIDQQLAFFITREADMNRTYTKINKEVEIDEDIFF